ncbi:MAG: hypothetical protein ACRDUV_18425 [Pseudonocardiaceae bacterium]
MTRESGIQAQPSASCGHGMCHRRAFRAWRASRTSGTHLPAEDRSRTRTVTASVPELLASAVDAAASTLTAGEAVMVRSPPDMLQATLGGAMGSQVERLTGGLPRKVDVLHGDEWVTGWLESVRNEGGRWQGLVRYSRGVGLTYLQWRPADELRRR